MKLFKRAMSLVIAAVLLLSCVYTGAWNAQAAAVDDYIASCTSYPANLRVKTTSSTPLMTYPCTTETQSESAVNATVATNTMLSVKALYKNTANEYWYEVLYYGSTLYVKAADTTMTAHLTGDVKIANVQSPTSLKYGSSFSIKGDISTSINELGKITAAMHNGSNITTGSFVSASDTADGNSYSLGLSTIDYGLKFGSLAAGVYTYVVTAEATSYYIDDNDALATSTRTVVLESQECVITDYENPNTAIGFGIDVSDWNGEIDWSKAAEEIDFAVICAAYGTKADTLFADYAKGCIDNDIPFGMYVYSYAETADEAVAEAKYVLNLVKGYKLDLPIWLYMGSDLQTELSTATKQAVAKAFCDTIAASGYQPGVYSSLSWITDCFSTAYFSSIPKWVIETDSDTCTYNGGTWMWQNSQQGTVDGITGNVNCNYYYAELPGLTSDTSYLSQCTYYPTHAIGSAISTVNVREYPSTSHTSQGLISSSEVVEITGLYKNAAGEYWYQVVVGSIYGYIRSDLLNVTNFLFDDVAIIDPVMASELNLGYGYPLSGKLVSNYNNIYAIGAEVYSGEDTLKSPVLNSTYINNSKFYNLYRSDVCNNLIFNVLDAGYYTYSVTVNIRNYRVLDGHISYQSKDVVVWTAPFHVKGSEEDVDTTNYYLFGYINGSDYACEADYENLGTYKFVDGKLTAKFTEDSYVAVKAEDNLHWYMTSGWQGMETTAVTLYNTETTLENSDKLYVPGNVEVVFSLLNKGDDTFTLSYIRADECEHSYRAEATANASCTQEGVDTFICTKCGHTYTKTTPALPHDYVEGSCSVCGKIDPAILAKDYYLFGYINEANYGCEEDAENLGIYKFVDGKLTVMFEKDSYVAVKTGDNGKWYMTDGWLGNDVTSATLYNTDAGIEANKLFVPADVMLTFTLVVNEDDTLTLSYAPYVECEHSYTEEVTTAPTCDKEGVKTFTCSDCGDSYTEVIPASGHTYVGGTCSDCGSADPDYNPDYYLIGYINGADYGCEGDYENLGEYKFVKGKLTATFTQDSYVFIKTGDNANWYMTEAYSEGPSATYIKGGSQKMLVPGNVEVTFTLVVNDDGTLTLSYTTPEPDPVVDYYLIGYINGANYGCEEDHENLGEYKFVNGKLVATFTADSYVFLKTGDNANWYMTETYSEGPSATFVKGATEKMFVPGNVEVTFTLVVNEDDTLTLSYTYAKCEHSYTAKVTTAATCDKDGVKTFTCSKCNDSYTQSIPATGHKFANGTCSVCGAADPDYVAPVTDYYLIGYINGANYGCEEDAANLGKYKFVNGELTATFTSDSYVFLKTGDNANWYMTETYSEGPSATFKTGCSEKMFVPGGVALTFTLTENADGSITLGYVTAEASVIPTIKLNRGSATFEDEVYISIYSTITDVEDIVYVGLLVSSDNVVDENDTYITEYDYKVSGSTYVVRSRGIPAKNLGELIYFKVYALLADGTYAYSRQYQYSPKVYAMDRLANSTDANLKSLCVAMLNYGAAAQTYFAYNTGNLANAELTTAQQALVSAYDASMVTRVSAADASKIGEFANTKGYSSRKPSVSFEGAFSISYYLIPKNTPENGITLYYWTKETYDSVDLLTKENADGVLSTTVAGTSYIGVYEGIAAKEIDQPVYVAGVYENNGTSYPTGVMVYSLGEYCIDRVNNGSAEMQPLAKATAVYGYYAKQYFSA